MDPFTHALLGAAIGQGVAGRRFGRRAALWGAAAGAAPDLDMLLGFEFFAQLRLHRGFTHALWFGPAAGWLWAWLLVRRGRRRGRAEPLQSWFWVLALALLSHALLDACTTYGTQLLAPFSDRRFSWHVIPVIEPRYTLILIAGLAAGWWLRARAQWFALAAVLTSGLYLGWGWWLNQRAIDLAEAQLAAQEVDAEVHAFPTLMQLVQRRLVAFADGEVRVGLVDAAAPACIAWGWAPRQPHPLVDRLRDTREGAIFSWFTDGVETWQVGDTPDGWRVEISDLRYGLDTDARQGLWGVRAEFGRDGRLRAAPEHFYAPIDWSWQTLQSWVLGAELRSCAAGIAALPPRQ